jgi:hypothetical protein
VNVDVDFIGNGDLQGAGMYVDVEMVPRVLLFVFCL